MYEMSQRHPVWVAENHVSPCNSAQGSLKIFFSEDSYSSVKFTLLSYVCLVTMLFKSPLFTVKGGGGQIFVICTKLKTL